MKKLAIALAACAALTGSAFAADLPVRGPVYKAPPPAPIASSWTGCYVSAGVGYGMLVNELAGTDTDPPVTITSTAAARGWLGRFGGGCDVQIGAQFVIGAFGDYDWMDIHGYYGDPLGSPSISPEKMRNAWYVGGRAGYLITPALLTYFSGGYTQAHIDGITVLGARSSLYLPEQDATGWFFGSGIEYAVSFLPVKGVTVKTEYRYASYDNFTQHYIHTDGRAGLNTVSNDVAVQTITTSLVWRFWSR